jgi:hypothetical protein
VSPPSPRPNVTVGITNTRLSIVKRGLATELARRIEAAAGTAVCIVGADPADRDVERRTPGLVATAGAAARRHLRVGPHDVDTVVLAKQRLTIVTCSDRMVVEKILPELQATFAYVVVDGPSGVGTGVGIAPMLWSMLDILLVASGMHAGELATTRAYVDALAEKPSARPIKVRVVVSGHADESGLAQDQLERRLQPLPVIARVPTLVEQRRARYPSDTDLDRALDPLVEWIVERPDYAAVSVAGVAVGSSSP